MGMTTTASKSLTGAKATWGGWTATTQRHMVHLGMAYAKRPSAQREQTASKNNLIKTYMHQNEGLEDLLLMECIIFRYIF